MSTASDASLPEAPMHDLFIAAAFLAIVISPAVAAFLNCGRAWSRYYE